MKQYEKALNAIQLSVENGQIKSGDKLPSIRELAQQLTLSPASIIKAYQHLESEHRVYVIPKSGYYWMERPADVMEETPIIDFTKMSPDNALIPFREFQHCLDQTIHIYKRELFKYGPTAGLESLRHVLVEHLAKRQIFCKSEQLVITAGSQQALSLLAMTTFDSTKKEILVEQPSYGVFQSLHALNGIKMTGIARTDTGLDFKALEAAMKTGRYKLFYTIPRCHNPLGTSLSEKDKLKLVALAHKYQVYLIEDDYLADLSYNSKSQPLYYYDTNQMVIYIKSFSKAFLPGIRLGIVVLPPKLQDAFTQQKRAHDLNTAVLSQGALEMFIASGMYDRHTQRCRRVYQKKCRLAASILATLTDPNVMVLMPTDGFLTWIGFSDDFPLTVLMENLKKVQIKVSAADDYYQLFETHPKGIRICFSTLSEQEIKTGLTALIHQIYLLL